MSLRRKNKVILKCHSLLSVILAAVFLGCPSGVNAWDHPSHMITAAIAFEEIERLRPDLMERMLDAYKAVYADAYLPRTLPERLMQSGFANVAAGSFVVLNTSFADDTYARQSAEFAVSIMNGSPQFSTAEQESWLQDQERLDRDGGFFFSLNRYILTAVK